MSAARTGPGPRFTSAFRFHWHHRPDPRQCIGSDLAIMEMQMIVATVAQTFRLTRVPTCTVTPTLAPTLRPLPALWMMLQARR